MLNVTTRTANAVLVIHLEGRIDGDESSGKIQDAAKEAIEQGVTNVLLDLREVQWINSLGVGFLVAAFISVKNQRGTLKLVGAPSRVVTVLHATGVIPNIIEIFTDEEEALASFS